MMDDLLRIVCFRPSERGDNARNNARKINFIFCDTNQRAYHENSVGEVPEVWGYGYLEESERQALVEELLNEI